MGGEELGLIYSLQLPWLIPPGKISLAPYEKKFLPFFIIFFP